MSQQSLGEILGVWSTYIGQIEKGSRIPSDERIKKLAEAFSLNVDLILITAHLERAKSKISRTLFKKIHKGWTEDDDVDLSKLNKAQRDSITALYNYWLNTDPSSLPAITIARLCNLPPEHKTAVVQIIKAFDT